MPKSKTPKKPKPAPERRHPKPALDPWLYSRKSAAALLDTSIDTVKSLERRGDLTAIRLTSPRGAVHYSREQLMSLLHGDGAKPRPAKVIT